MASFPLDVRPIYSRDQGIRMRGLKIHRLCLNRHLPKVDRIADHAHAHSQILLYLGGAGWQKIAGEPTKSGAARCFSCRRARGIRSSTPAVTSRCAWPWTSTWKTRRPCPRPLRTLTLLDLKRVRQRTRPADPLAHRPRGDRTARGGGGAAADRPVFPRARTCSRPTRCRPGATCSKPCSAFSHQPTRPGTARRAGPPDRLSARLSQPDAQTGVRSDAGRTARGRAPANRPPAACSETRPMAEVASETGFDDPNYFSRWFRAQTGCTPTAWRRRVGSSEA